MLQLIINLYKYVDNMKNIKQPSASLIVAKLKNTNLELGKQNI